MRAGGSWCYRSRPQDEDTRQRDVGATKDDQSGVGHEPAREGHRDTEHQDGCSGRDREPQPGAPDAQTPRDPPGQSSAQSADAGSDPQRPGVCCVECAGVGGQERPEGPDEGGSGSHNRRGDGRQTSAERLVRPAGSAGRSWGNTNPPLPVRDARQHSAATVPLKSAISTHANSTPTGSKEIIPAPMSPVAAPELTIDWAVADRCGATVESMIGTSAAEASPPLMPPTVAAARNSAGWW